MNPEETPSTLPERNKEQKRSANLASALSGLGVYAQRSRRNLVVEGLCGLAALGLGLALQLDALRLGVILLTIALVIALEMVNTAIESLLDVVQPDLHPTVKRIKDVSAGAVLIVSLGAVALGLLLFWEPLGLPAFEIARFFVIAGVGIFLLGWLLSGLTES
ncbi:MAG: diacylglycerol kinase [Candidatus Bipolaricaulota bacterium]|nr:diacylglycerol kinase [Candidatus Bipolaricaulota bacterium]MCS7275228.1 diacylglycerol kinase [Candidatus Bipolaricaulota bacterium]MDW8111070.1 diacylglycerol kinase [Candidatus Bipolaricaulota bacterium]MDW8329559.1 diacylglycerol kinase [Candidatus Bipolaricaulota bacterium]